MSPGEPPRDAARTRMLLAAAVAFPAVFYGSVAVQALVRPDFDITQHPLSLLALGEYGWIQTTTFIVTGALAIVGAAGLRASMHGLPGRTWAPILVAAFGAGMIIAGIFPADPALGFPPGAPEGTPETISTTAQIHGLGFFLAFGSLTAACVVFARRWRTEDKPRWAMAGFLVGLLTPILIALGMVIPSATSELFAIAGIPPFAVIAGTAMHLRRTKRLSSPAAQQIASPDAASRRG